jgi:hypothetical protein
MAVSRYSAVRVKSLYREADVLYYFRGERFEFDINLRPGSGPAFLASESKTLVTSVLIPVEISQWKRMAEAIDFFVRRPIRFETARVLLSNAPIPWTLTTGSDFDLAKYDRSQELIIDPVVDFLTYLGARVLITSRRSGPLRPATSSWPGSSSANFPGGGTPAGSFSIFVSKLNATGSSRGRGNGCGGTPCQEVNRVVNCRLRWFGWGPRRKGPPARQHAAARRKPIAGCG